MDRRSLAMVFGLSFLLSLLGFAIAQTIHSEQFIWNRVYDAATESIRVVTE